MNSQETRQRYQDTRRSHWDAVAIQSDGPSTFGRTYHNRLENIYQLLIPPGQRVIEIGCGKGDLLAALSPALGVGIDFSEQMIRCARTRHPSLHFVTADAHAIPVHGHFDFVILSDLTNDLWDVQAVLQQVERVAAAHTRIILNHYSRLWELPLALAQHLGLRRPTLEQSWLSVDDVKGLLNLANFEMIRDWEEVLCPLPIPFLDAIANRWLARVWPFRYLALTHFVVARLAPSPQQPARRPRVSVIIPARNEAGNIAQAYQRVPEMGIETELIFVEGHSKDDTLEAIERERQRHPKKRCTVVRQKGTGKGDAVRLGFALAQGDILMILDADLTVAPEDLPRFYEALVSGKGEFVNGVRLVYPMEKEAMRFFNFVANKSFSLCFSWLLGQPVKDTLCGTKVLWKSDYERISQSRSYFGEFDPFGDFDLLFGAAKLNLKIAEVPIRYRERAYGSTNIQRWKHGWLLLKMVFFAARRIKFV